ncbi:MAG: superoxide dismutase [Bacteroidetes bacterium]|nr:superoxide dismutase [Bacteroidota bacterium]
MKILRLLPVIAMIIFSTNVKAQFTQEPLPYAYDALEPYIDARTMDIHFNRHHAGYVKNLNNAVSGTTLEKMSLEDILVNVSQYDVAVRNNGGGHYNHQLFWAILTPEKNTQPSTELNNAITSAFGNMDELKAKLNKEAASRFGSGWAWLYVNENGGLAVCSTPNQDNPLMDVSSCKGIPILGIDVWEHAYYLNYQNKRGDYLNAIWSLINWKEVSRNYELALQEQKK